MAGIAVRIIRTADSRLSSIVRCHISSVIARNPSRRGGAAPTLLTRMSIRPLAAAGTALVRNRAA
jgi:hypothetical protein